jgi:hypothetical protein
VRLCIVSGCTSRRFWSDTNHRVYAAIHSYDYQSYSGDYISPKAVSFFKVQVVRKALNGYDWLLWLDDDAFFTNFGKSLDYLFEGLGPNVFLIVCKSPVDPRGRFTFINSGVFLLRNCAQAVAFLDAVDEAPVDAIKAWWDAGIMGGRCEGDQSAMVYVLHQRNLLGGVKILPFDAFNNRPYHYEMTSTEHFIVHFAGVPDRTRAIRTFAHRFGLDGTSLVPRALLMFYEKRILPQSVSISPS